MADQTKMTPEPNREKKKPSNTLHCIPKAPLNEQRNKRYVDITAMIRSLQRTEGFTDCFRRGGADCDQLDCAWRQYCLGSAKSIFEHSTE